MYCISCGTKGVKWPKNAPMCCTMHCAANRLLGEYNASPDGFHCPDCGEPADDHDCGTSEDEEETVEFSLSTNWMDRLLRRKS
jgi:hypothetical protein